MCILTLCLSICNGRRYGSNRSLSGSTFIGDCRRPLLHIFHCGLIRPQKPGPENIEYKLCYTKKRLNYFDRYQNGRTVINYLINIASHSTHYIFTSSLTILYRSDMATNVMNVTMVMCHKFSTH